MKLTPQLLEYIMNTKLSMAVKIGLFGCAIATSTSAFATHGMLTAARSARSAGMGGASVAVTNGTVSATEVNPANIAFATRDTVIFDFGLMAPSVKGKDASMIGGQSHDADSSYFPVHSFSYVHVIDDSNWTLGLGSEALGGMGAKYSSLNGMNQPGHPGAHESQIGYMTLNFIAAYKLTDNWAVSVAPFISYSQMAMKTPMLKATEMTATGVGVKLGSTYKINQDWSVGGSFTTEDSLDYKGDIDTTGMGGNKQSGTAHMAWPAEVTLGTAYQATEKLLVAFDVSWIGWKSAMDKMDMHSNSLKNSQNPNGDMSMDLSWDDQITYTIGAEYALTNALTLRSGYSYGKNPVPSETVMPLFPAITEHHLSAGLSYDVTSDFSLTGAVEYAFSNTQRNTSQPSQTTPFGGSESTLAIWTVGVGAAYSF